jgi:hypothetical protein
MPIPRENNYRAFNNPRGACSCMVWQPVSSAGNKAGGIDREAGVVYGFRSAAGFHHLLYYGVYYHSFIPWRADEITPYFYAHKINSYVY